MTNIYSYHSNKIAPLALFLLALVFFVPPLRAQEKTQKFDVGIQIRPRAEFRNGQGTLIAEGQNPAFYINNRSRIKASYISKKVSLGIAGQSVGVWGQQPQSELQGGFMLNEAWAKLSLNDYWSFVIGRQALIYDAERILGGLDWHVSGRYHDLLLTKFEKNKFKGHIGLAYNANSETKTQTYFYTTGQPYQHMEFGWFSYQLSEPLKITALIMNTGFQSGIDTVQNTWKISNMQTLGANLFYEKSKLKMHGLFYFQTGLNQSENSVEAYMASLSANYKITKKTALFAGLDYLSGNNMKNNSSTENAFAPLYGTNHGYYGYMDYFYVGNYASNVGLIDIYAGFSHIFTDKYSMRVGLHGFNSAAQIVNEKGQNASRMLGTEIDISFNYKLMTGVTLVGGYSQLFATESMNLAKEVSNPKSLQNWAWLMLNVDLIVFKTSFTNP